MRGEPVVPLSCTRSESSSMAKWVATSELETGATEATLTQTIETPEPIRTVRGFRGIVYWAMAGFFFVLAMVGVVLPGIPTTPFLILMCYFLVRVSPSLHAKAMAWPVVGGPLRDWRDQGGVRTSVKITACAMVTLMVGSMLIWGTLSPSIKVAILIAALCGVSVVVRLPRAIVENR